MPRNFCQDGLDWIGLLSGTGVATAPRIVQWPTQDGMFLFAKNFQPAFDPAQPPFAPKTRICINVAFAQIILPASYGRAALSFLVCSFSRKSEIRK